jgi:hypothetical protein
MTSMDIAKENNRLKLAVRIGDSPEELNSRYSMQDIPVRKYFSISYKPDGTADRSAVPL